MPEYTIVDNTDITLHVTRNLGKAGMANTCYGWIPGSKPAELPKSRTSGERCLKTTDIIGAQPDTKRKGAFTWMDRRDVREVNRTNDIYGCAADTINRAPKTKRNLNPLDP